MICCIFIVLSNQANDLDPVCLHTQEFGDFLMIAMDFLEPFAVLALDIFAPGTSHYVTNGFAALRKSITDVTHCFA